MADYDWRQNLTPNEVNQRRLDTRLWDEQQAAQHKRECPSVYTEAEAERASGEPVQGRDTKDVAAEFVAKIEAKYQARQVVERCDLAYVLVLSLRHGLKLASDFERELREACGWIQKDELQPPEPEPYEEHAMGLHD